MKYCPFCGSALTNEMVYCPKCGKKHVLPQNNSDAFCAREPTEEGKEEKVPPKSKTHIRFVVVSLSIVLIVAIAIVASIIVLKNNNSNTGFSIKTIVDKLTTKELSAQDIAKLSSSVVTLYVYDKNRELLSTGSGFFINNDRTIVTNYHVIDQGFFVEAVSEQDLCYNISGATFFNEKTDIAILQSENATGIEPLPLGDSSTVEAGDTIYAIGSPLGLKNTVSDGIVSSIRGEGTYSDIQITAPISSGSSGGVLLNAYGEAIGITYASYTDGQNLNLAIPSAEFSDKVFSNEITSFEKIVLYNTPMGNTPENYSQGETLVVQYGNTTYESNKDSAKITAYNTDTQEIIDLDILGTNLSIFHGILYYISPNNAAVGSYNIETGAHCENILLSYSLPPHLLSISKLFVSNSGIVIIYGAGPLYLLDFDGSIIGSLDQVPSDITMIEKDMLLAAKSYANTLEFISLPDLETLDIAVDFDFVSLHSYSNGFAYFNNYIINFSWPWTTQRELIKYSIETNTYTIVESVSY